MSSGDSCGEGMVIEATVVMMMVEVVIYRFLITSTSYLGTCLAAQLVSGGGNLYL